MYRLLIFVLTIALAPWGVALAQVPPGPGPGVRPPGPGKKPPVRSPSNPGLIAQRGKVIQLQRQVRRLFQQKNKLQRKLKIKPRPRYRFGGSQDYSPVGMLTYSSTTYVKVSAGEVSSYLGHYPQRGKRIARTGRRVSHVKLVAPLVVNFEVGKYCDPRWTVLAPAIPMKEGSKVDLQVYYYRYKGRRIMNVKRGFAKSKSVAALPPGTYTISLGGKKVGMLTIVGPEKIKSSKKLNQLIDEAKDKIKDLKKEVKKLLEKLKEKSGDGPPKPPFGPGR